MPTEAEIAAAAAAAAEDDDDDDDDDDEAEDEAEEDEDEEDEDDTAELDKLKEIAGRLRRRRDEGLLREHRLTAILQAHLPDVDIKDELSFVGGDARVEKGKVVGESKYRPAGRTGARRSRGGGGGSGPGRKSARKAAEPDLSKMTRAQRMEHWKALDKQGK